EGPACALFGSEGPIGRPGDAHELMRFLLTHRDDEAPAGSKLFEQGLRDTRAAGRNHDRVVRRVLRPAEGPVTVVEEDVVESELPEADARRLRELCVPLDGV